MMDTVHSPEPESLAQIERLGLEADEIQRRLRQVESAEEQRQLDSRLALIQRQVKSLQHRPN